MTKYKGDMIEPIPDTPEDVAWAITREPPKQEWRYLEKFREPDEEDEEATGKQVYKPQRAACKILIDSERRKNTQASNDVRARQLARF